jgi:hypothetical protein
MDTKAWKEEWPSYLGLQRGFKSVNSDFTKLACDELWGVIEHPSIGDLVNMILGFFEESRRIDPKVIWSDLVMWKIDLKGAYTLLSFQGSAVPFMAVGLDTESVIFFLCGVFGW